MLSSMSGSLNVTTKEHGGCALKRRRGGGVGKSEGGCWRRNLMQSENRLQAADVMSQKSLVKLGWVGCHGRNHVQPDLGPNHQCNFIIYFQLILYPTLMF